MENYQDYYNRRADKSLSNFDVRHRLTANLVWRLPFGAGRKFLREGALGKIIGGFSFSGLVNAQSGYPLSVAAAGRKEDPLQYLERRIFNPIGLKYARWTRAADGNPQLPAGAFLTAREWAKFGLLVMNKGKWEGRQIIPAKLLAECFTGSQANPAYGLTFWLNRPGLGAQASEPGETAQNNRRRQSGAGIYPGGPRDLVMAAGAGKQRLYIIPSRDLVIVRQGEVGPFDDARFLARLLDGRAPAEQ